MHAAQTFEGRPSEAEHRYLDIARNLGWKEGSAAAAATMDENEGQEDRSSGGTGMGISVSTISRPTPDEDGSVSGLHDYAMRDDVAAISAFLGASQGANINAKDEYVSLLYPTIHRTRLMSNISVLHTPGVHCASPGCGSGQHRHGRVSTQARRR